ncbi:MAG: hypothetical protein Q9157_001095 [Trypethelium eluteriae]
MPMKFAKGFGRRKSSGNALDYELPSENAPSSFRVLERPQSNATMSFDSSPAVTSRNSGGRHFGSPQTRSSGEDDGLGSNRSNNKRDSRRLTWRLTWDRGSGGSGNTTNSASTGYYDSSSAASARFSSHSTLPQADPDEELFPVRRSKTFHPEVNTFKDLPPPPKHKERTFSFGRIGKRASSPPRPKTGVDLKQSQDINPPTTRERAQTTSSYATESSYASTVVPPPPNLDPSPSLVDSDFGADFGTNMFDGLGKRSSVTLDQLPRKTPSPTAPLPRSVS